MTGEPRPLSGKPVIYHFCWIVAQYTLYNIQYIHVMGTIRNWMEGLQGLGKQERNKKEERQKTLIFAE